MKTYLIKFCYGANCSPETINQIVKALNESDALHNLYLSHWGHQIFVKEIKASQIGNGSL